MSIAGQAAVGSRADRTPTEQKLDSTLMFAVRAATATAAAARIPQSMQSAVQSFVDDNVTVDQTIFVVIKAKVSPDLIAALRDVDSRDISEFPQYGIVTARVPITAILDIAARSDVTAVDPQERLETHRYILNRLYRNMRGFGSGYGNGCGDWIAPNRHWFERRRPLFLYRRGDKWKRNEPAISRNGRHPISRCGDDDNPDAVDGRLSIGRFTGFIGQHIESGARRVVSIVKCAATLAVL